MVTRSYNNTLSAKQVMTRVMGSSGWPKIMKIATIAHVLEHTIKDNLKLDCIYFVRSYYSELKWKQSMVHNTHSMWLHIQFRVNNCS